MTAVSLPRPYIKSLLLGISVQVNRKVDILQGSLKHGDGVRLVVIRVDTFLRQHTGDILEQGVQLQLPLLVRNLQATAITVAPYAI